LTEILLKFGVFVDFFKAQDTPNNVPCTQILTLKIAGKYRFKAKKYIVGKFSRKNDDYKLFVKILAARVQAVMASLIAWGQSACIAGVSCIENLIQLRNIMTSSGYIPKNEERDHDHRFGKKTFDRVDHRYLWKCLAKFNFPERFIDNLKHLYSGATSRVYVNVVLTGSIDIKNSVRDRDALSA
jgi:hypothetical protein